MKYIWITYRDVMDLKLIYVNVSGAYDFSKKWGEGVQRVHPSKTTPDN